MNNRGQIKVADFGLARTYGEPLGSMTQLVVTLWYRAPELLMGSADYSTAIDLWSIGCIFGELIQKDPLLPGKGEIDQVNRVRGRGLHCLTLPDLQAARAADRRGLARLLEAAECQVVQCTVRPAVRTPRQTLLTCAATLS